MGSVKRDRKSLECERRAGGKQILILRYHAGSSMHGPSDDPENKSLSVFEKTRIKTNHPGDPREGLGPATRDKNATGTRKTYRREKERQRK